MYGDWATLSAAVAMVLTTCDNVEDWQTIIDHSAAVRAKLDRIKHDVEVKADAHQILRAYLEACSAAEENTSRLQAQLQGGRLTADEMPQLWANIDEIRSQLSQLESRHPEMTAVMDKAGLVVKDRATQAAVEFDTSIQNLLDGVACCFSELDVKAEKLAKVSEMWLVYGDIKTNVLRDLQELQESISAAEVEELSLAGVRVVMGHLLGAQLRWSESSSSYKRLSSSKQQLVILDPSSADKLEDDFSQTEAARNALQSVLLDNIHSAAVVIESWQPYDEIKDNVESVCIKAKSLLAEPVPLCNLQALRERLLQTKVF